VARIAAAMRVFAGTSGFSYDEWHPSFYPEDLPASERLSYYATKLTTVEINNTFYRTPKREVIEGWRDKVSDAFRFVIKASQRLTHQKRMKDCGEDLAYALGAYAAIEPKLGAVLFQFPPNLRQDLARLGDFCACLPQGTRAAFEFRHASWFADATYAVLAERNLALVASETDEEPSPAVVRTADFGYLRLRRTSYGPGELDQWAERLRAQDWREAFVFFKHEDAGTGPRLAQEFLQRFAGWR
jgi:uncharacterized protein YecE (DUF72 family)